MEDVATNNVVVEASNGPDNAKFLKRRGSHRQNGVIQPLLTDLYQITMAYAYWKAEKTSDCAVFDLFFRKNPFHGEFTIFAGLEEVLKFLENFHYSDSDIEYLRETLPQSVEPAFFDFLKNLTADEITVYAIDEGCVAFPKIPLLRIEGPLIVAQLLETTLLTLVNYASLVATNAARYRIAAGYTVQLLEFGLRRAQGPDGGLSASKYAYLGGFDGTSNVLAGKLYQIPVKGTHAHAYISSFTDCKELKRRTIKHKDTQEEVDFIDLCRSWKEKLTPGLDVLREEASDGELAAFASYAIAFPDSFVALVDTYDTAKSGLLNFCAVAMALNDMGYQPQGIRIDSGDLAYLSTMARQKFEQIAEKFDRDWFRGLTIVASNDINEETIWSLNEQGHQINCFGIGTHLVTCQRQPALGCVYKLVEINHIPKIKLSEDVEKVTMPGMKDVYRLYGADGHALIDLLVQTGEDSPKAGSKVLCRHPFHESKRAWVSPAKVEPLYHKYWKDGVICRALPQLSDIRQRVTDSMKTIRQDHKRNLNPTPYKVAVSDRLYHFIHDLWLENAPIGELS
ncbi:Nicotinate phosphoribosyltransferase [Orchesella cincta]|uniref:Nicotinate phosphoribosyltransferase n=1 Tax=Orchesella cincta TaxID=48709 RepID=A0A1D2NIX7_ORCCI|nr:Nicotinate phosphoribosyltransferase [Orchesella cincta]